MIKPSQNLPCGVKNIKNQQQERKGDVILDTPVGASKLTISSHIVLLLCPRSSASRAAEALKTGQQLQSMLLAPKEELLFTDRFLQMGAEQRGDLIVW